MHGSFGLTGPAPSLEAPILSALGGRVTAGSTLTVGTPVANPPVVDAGEPLGLNVTISGGSGGYNITWLGLPAGCTSVNASKLTCHPENPISSSTTYSVTVQVVDGAGANVTSNATAVQVNQRLSVSVGDGRNLGIVPVTITYVATTVGGTPPFQFSWLFGDGTNGSGNPVTHTYSSVGTYIAYVFVNDSFGEFASARYQPVQAAPPVSVSLSATPGSLSVGDALVLDAVAYGGFPTYVYAWSNLPPGCFGGNLASISCAPSGSGAYTISVLVTDRFGNQAETTVKVNVSLPELFSSGGLTGWIILLGGAASLIAAALWVRRSPGARNR